MSSSDKTNQQTTMIQNYHNNHLDYRNGSQMSFYDNQQPYKCADDEMHRKHYFPDRQQTDSMHSGSDASSKSEQQMPNLYHQQNGYRMKPKNQLANNNECELTSDDYVHQRNPKKTNSQYGKILNCKKLSSKDHRNGSRPIPMLPSPPSTPPPPLNAKIKDHHESSNKFYQEFQSNVHLGSQHSNPSRFNGNINNNNNEVKIIMRCATIITIFNCF